MAPIGEWFHLGITFAGGDSSEVVYYINGSSVTVTNPTGTPSGTQGADDNIKDVGGAGASVVWDGFISEFAIFAGHQLDADAVAAVYQSGVQGFNLLADSGNYDYSANLDGWWKIDNAQTVLDLKGSTNGPWNNTPNMATVPESTTAGLSTFGTLTSKRSGSAVLNLQQTGVASTAAVCGYAQTPSITWDATKFTIAVWVKVTATPVNGDRIINFSHGGKFVMLRMYDTGKPYLHVDGGGVTTNNPDLDIRNSWALIVIRRTAAAAFTTGARLISGGSFTSNATTPSSVVLDTSGTIDWGCQSSAKQDGISGQIAMPKIFNGESLSDADLNSLFESGKRMLLGVS